MSNILQCGKNKKPAIQPLIQQQQYVGLLDMPKGNWTKMTRSFPSGFSEEQIRIHQEKSGAHKHLTAGYRMFKSEKVKDALLSYTPTHSFCKAKVEASFSISHLYIVHLKISNDGCVEAGFCNCKAGAGGVCKHVVALLWFLFDVLRQGHQYIPATVSCTEKCRKWGTGPKKESKNVTKFDKLNFIKHKLPVLGEKNTNLIKNKKAESKTNKIKATTEALTNLHSVLTNFNILPMLCDTLADHQFEPIPICQEPDTYNVLVDTQTNLNITPICGTGLPEVTPPKLPLMILWNSNVQHVTTVMLSLGEAQELEKKTRTQSEANLWHQERASRITASKFGDIVNRKANTTPDFINSIFKSSKFSNKYMSAGLLNEEVALKKYCQNKPISIFKTGLCVNPGVPFLGATPDGLVFDHTIQEFGLVEVKTLSKAMELGFSVAEAIDKKKAPFLLVKTKRLSERHKYFYQIQGQMALTGLTWCDLVVDSGKDILVERVMFNQSLWEDKMLPKLTLFYDLHNPTRFTT